MENDTPTRGRYSKKTKTQLVAGKSVSRMEAEIARLADKYQKASNLTPGPGRESAARSLAILEIRFQRMLELDLSGKMSADEAKQYPMVSKEMRALRDELGITSDRDDGDDL